MKRVKVTIIEDEDAHLELMERTIKREFPDAHIDRFDEIERCLDSVDQINPDIIITDYLLPGMNGLEFLEELQRRNKEIPVVVVTGQGDENIAVKAMKLGAYDYIVKSADFFSLVPSIIQKVIHQKKLKKALQESQALYEQERNKLNSILASMVNPLAVTNENMTINFVNPVFERAFGKDLLGKPCQDIFSKSCDVNAPCRKAIRDRQTQNREVEDINGRIWHVTIAPGIELEGGMVTAVLVFQDITELKRTEEQIRILSQQLMRAQESERQRISRDLHDNLAQDLSTLKIGLDTLLDTKTPPETRQSVSELSKTLQGTITAVRDLAYDLRPPGLDQLGLLRTVSQYCEDFSDKNGIGIDFYSAGLADLRLDFDTEINLYRLIQESFNNIKKHADASQVTIRLVASFPNIILRIEDNGKGFDMKNRMVSAANEKRMGLRSMEERVSLLHGTMRIQSRPTDGTSILIEVPYKEKKNDPQEKRVDH